MKAANARQHTHARRTSNAKPEVCTYVFTENVENIEGAGLGVGLHRRAFECLEAEYGGCDGGSWTMVGKRVTSTTGSKIADLITRSRR